MKDTKSDHINSEYLHETAASSLTAAEMLSDELEFCIRDDTRLKRAISFMLMSSEDSFDSSLEPELKNRGHRVLHARSSLEAVKQLQAEDIGVIIADISILSEAGSATLSVCKKLRPECLVVVSTDFGRSTLADLAGDGEIDFVVSSACRYSEIEDLVDAISTLNAGVGK